MNSSVIQKFKDSLFSFYPSFSFKYGIDFIHQGSKDDELIFSIIWTKSVPETIREKNLLQQRISDIGKLFQIRINFS